MAPKESYTGKDFNRYARKNFPKEFAAFRDVYRCDLQSKTFLDDQNTAHGIRALLVGHYHTKKGGPPVWAQATTTGVRYFSGKTIESICVPIPEQHVSRIYYTAPYDTVLGTHDGGSRTAGRKAGHYFVEMIIKILFLLAGQIEHVENPGQTDMLANFKYVCVDCVHKPEIQEVSHVPLSRQSEIIPPQNAPGRETRKRKRASDDHGQRIKQEDMEAGQPAQHVSSDTPPYRVASNTPQTSLSDQLRNYEAEMASKRAREKQEHVEEVTRLRAERDEQEQRARLAEEKAMKERKKRKGAEEQVESLQGQIADLQSQIADLQSQIAARHEQPAYGDFEHSRTYRNMHMRLLSQRKELTRLRLAAEKRKYTIKVLEDQLAKKEQL